MDENLEIAVEQIQSYLNYWKARGINLGTCLEWFDTLVDIRNWELVK